MQCAKFEQRLQQLLDDRKNVEQDELLREHSQACEACNSVLRSQSRLFSGMSLLPEPGFAQDLGPRVVDQLRVDHRRRTNRRFVMAALATAAAIMIALLPWAGEYVRYHPKGGPAGGGLAIATTPPRQVTGSGLTEQESEDIRRLMHQMMLSLSDHRLSMFEPVDQLASGIRPLAITFGFAIDTLRRTLPGYSLPQQIDPPQAAYRDFRTFVS